jgi:hypothetical protein
VASGYEVLPLDEDYTISSSKRVTSDSRRHVKEGLKQKRKMLHEQYRRHVEYSHRQFLKVLLIVT